MKRPSRVRDLKVPARRYQQANCQGRADGISKARLCQVNGRS